MEFPDVWNCDLYANDYEVAKQAIDFAISQHLSTRKGYNYIADNYNGVNIGARFDYLTKTYGKESRTKYVDYKIGRSKVLLLVGEFLSANLNASVSTINREAMRRKYEKYIDLKALSQLKPHIEAVRNMGLNVFPGVNIPDPNDQEFWKTASFKEKNEVIMQKILNWRIRKDDLKLKLVDAVTDNILYSEMHSVIEKGVDGVETIRTIPSKNAMYLELEGDTMLTKTPYKGEEKDMFYHEIMRLYGRYMDKEIKEKVKNFKDNISSTADSKYYNNKDGYLSIKVHHISFKCPDVIYFKKYTTKTGIESTKRLSSKYVKEHAKEIENPEKYGVVIEKFYKQSVFNIAKIGNEIYIPIGHANNQIQTKKNRKNFYVEYDHTSMLVGTVNGTRIALFEMIIDLSITYNIIRFMMNRELQKSKGKILGYDKAFMSGNSMKDIFHRMVEDGILEVNSAKEGLDEFNYNVLDKIFKEYDMGVSSSFNQLILAAQDIERTLDSLTGINQNREGITRSTETATGIQSSITASRSITNLISYSTNVFIKETFRKLLEKIKINKELLESDELGLILSDEEQNFIVATYDVSNDEYGVDINDGRKEAEVKSLISQFYGQQVNAGMLSVHDIARAEMEEDFSSYINVLENAWATIEENAKASEQAKYEDLQKGREMQIEMAREDREDKQGHEKDMELLVGEVKKEIEVLKGQIKGAQLAMQIDSTMQLADKQAEETIK